MLQFGLYEISSVLVNLEKLLIPPPPHLVAFILGKRHSLWELTHEITKQWVLQGDSLNDVNPSRFLSGVDSLNCQKMVAMYAVSTIIM